MYITDLRIGLGHMNMEARATVVAHGQDEVYALREMYYTPEILLTNSINKYAIKRVIFNGPATIVLWEDDTKTVVKCGEGETYDAEKGLAMCFMKKALGNKGSFNNVLKEHLNNVN